MSTRIKRERTININNIKNRNIQKKNAKNETRKNKQNIDPNLLQRNPNILQRRPTPLKQIQTAFSQSNLSSNQGQKSQSQKNKQQDQKNKVIIKKIQLVEIKNEQKQLNRQKTQRYNNHISKLILSPRSNQSKSLQIKGKKIKIQQNHFRRSCVCCKNKKIQNQYKRSPNKIIKQSQENQQYKATAQIPKFKDQQQRIDQLKTKQDYRLKRKVEYQIHNKIKKNTIMRLLLFVDTSYFNYFWPEFRLYLNYNQKQIIYAKKQSLTLKSKYKIYTKLQQSDEQICVGKVRSNFQGSMYNIYRSLNTKDYYLVCSVIYNKNNEQPQQFQVYYLDDFHDLLLQQYHPQRQINSLKQLINEDKFKNLIHKAHTRKPSYNRHLRIHTLDFNKRTKMNSSKNFILENNQLKEQILMLGKLSQDMYNCQMTYPLNPILSLGIILTKFQNKMII